MTYTASSPTQLDPPGRTANAHQQVLVRLLGVWATVVTVGRVSATGHGAGGTGDRAEQHGAGEKGHGSIGRWLKKTRIARTIARLQIVAQIA